MLRKGNNELLTQKRKEQLKGTVRSVLLLTCLTMFIILYSKIYEQQLVINELEAENTQCNNAIIIKDSSDTFISIGECFTFSFNISYTFILCSKSPPS